MKEKKRKKVGSREKTMTNGNGNPNLKWERQPTAASRSTYLAENISYGFRIYGHMGVTCEFEVELGCFQVYLKKYFLKKMVN